MAKNNNLGDFLTDIANSIRAKTGETEPINPQEFSSKILQMSSGTVFVTEYLDKSRFPEVGESNIIYIADDTNMIYRWDSENGKYATLGFDPDEITLINANGGN